MWRRSLDRHFERARARCWDLYEKYYPNGSYRTHLDRYRDAMAPYLTSTATVLDAGCGTQMTFTREIAPRIRHAVGLDIDSIERGGDAPDACRGSLLALPFADRKFDLAISMSVVEHLQEPEIAFRELRRVLKPGGAIVILTPNRFDYVSIIAQATPFWFHQWIVSRTLGKKERDVFPTLYRANTQGALERALSRSGFRPRAVTLFNQYPAYLMFSSLMFRLGVLYERVTSRNRLLAPLRGWILVVAERVD